MLLYSMRKIMRAAGRSSNRIVLILEAMVSKRMPKNIYDPIFKYCDKDFSGQSFIINPEGLLKASATNKEIAEYLALASYRNYSYYQTTNDASLDLFHSPMSEHKIKQNRLLSIRNGRIHFKYEEVT